MLSLLRFGRWILTKLAGGVLIALLGLGLCAGWLYLKDNADFEQWRQDRVRDLTGERAKLEQAYAGVQRQLADLSEAIATERGRVRQADKVITDLKGLDRTWDRLFGSAAEKAQQQTNRDRLGAVTAVRRQAADRVASLERTFTELTWTRDGLEIALGKQDAKLQRYEAQRSKIAGYLERTWNHEVGRGVLRLPLKEWVLLVLGLYFVGPSAGRVALYFAIAPWVTRGRPVRLTAAMDALPQVGESSVAVELRLRPGERVRIKEKFLQASDEGLQRRTRYLLDWSIPLTCVAAGLIELIEMANRGTEAGDQRLTLSNQADPHSELAIVTLPAGASLVLRPSFLAGVATTEGQRLVIRRRWQLFRWQAWVTLQFRFFEFVGPCRLILAGSRGIRAENLADREGPSVPARRTNQDATVGFTPNLDYRPVRAETFWSYYRGMNPLFDDLFAGRGLFLCQQVATEGDAKKARKFWAGIWAGVMKVFGL